MTALTRVAILFCGQGMATLIEYYPDGDKDSVPTQLVLVDFGGNQRYAEIASAYVVEKLQAQASGGIDPFFTAVVISHQDGDHLSLLPSLQTGIKDGGIEVRCDNWYAGGTAWSAANKKKVESFAAMLTDDDEEYDLAFNGPFNSNYTGAKKRADVGHLANFGKTFIRVVISGLKLSSGGEDIIRNASSSVVAVENGEWSMILPGDATYHTMARVNDFYKVWKSTPLIPTVFALEIPHHGALRTAVENYTAKTPLAELDFSIINKFSSNLAPQEVVASAGIRNNHNHPIKEVLDVFTTVRTNSYSQNYVAYVFDKKKSKKVEGWEEFSTKKGIATTVRTITGTATYGNLFYNIRDSAVAGARPEVKIEFEPGGTLAELAERFGERAASDPWLQSLLREDAGARVPDAPLRAPPPDRGEGAG